MEQEKGGAGGGGSAAGRGWVLLEWSRNGGSREGGRGGVGRGGERGGGGSGAGEVGWTGEGGPKRGAFDETSWAFALVLKSPTEKRKFLVGVQGGAGRDGSGGGGGVGLGGGWVEWEGGPKHGPFWWDLVGMRVGSELPKTEKRKFLVGFPGQCGVGREGSGGGAGSGAGGGWVEWEGGKVEPEGEGSGGGGGGSGAGGGVGWSGSQARSFWWDLVGMRVGFEPPKTEKQKFVVGVSGQGGAGKAGSGGEAGVALGGGLGGWHERLQLWTLRLGSCNAAATQVEMHVHSLN